MVYIAIIDIIDNKYQCRLLGEEGSILDELEIPEGEFEQWIKSKLLKKYRKEFEENQKQLEKRNGKRRKKKNEYNTSITQT